MVTVSHVLEVPDLVDCRLRIQQFLCVSNLCRDVVLGRDFLTVNSIPCTQHLVAGQSAQNHKESRPLLGWIRDGLKQSRIAQSVCVAFLLRMMPLPVRVCQCLGNDRSI